MKPKKYRLPPPPRSDAPPAPAEIIDAGGQIDAGSLPRPLPVAYERGSSEADGVNIIEMTPAPKRWLHVTLALPAGSDPAQTALAAAWFATRLRALDKRLRLTVAREKSGANADELVLAFAPLRGGLLAAEWLEEVKPAARALALAEFEGAEVKSVEVVVETRS